MVMGFICLYDQDLIEMDREDEVSGRMEYIHEELISGYYKLFPTKDSDKPDISNVDDSGLSITELHQFSSGFS